MYADCIQPPYYFDSMVDTSNISRSCWKSAFKYIEFEVLAVYQVPPENYIKPKSPIHKSCLFVYKLFGMKKNKPETNITSPSKSNKYQTQTCYILQIVSSFWPLEPHSQLNSLKARQRTVYQEPTINLQLASGKHKNSTDLQSSQKGWREDSFWSCQCFLFLHFWKEFHPL